jgi:Protein of unknown function (DUF2917)
MKNFQDIILQPGQTRSLEVTQVNRLEVCSGSLWVTVYGQLQDFVVGQGECLGLGPLRVPGGQMVLESFHGAQAVALRVWVRPTLLDKLKKAVSCLI